MKFGSNATADGRMRAASERFRKATGEVAGARLPIEAIVGAPLNSLILPDSPGREKFLRAWLPIGLFSILWLDLFRLLSSNWATREQYAYGWFIPSFIVYFLWRRWMDCPQWPADSVRQAGLLTRGIVWLAALSLLPMRIIYEVNRDWPFISWPYAIAVVLLTLYALGLAHPRWRQHFGFPVCLVFLAVMWPGVVENAVTQGLMRVVTSVTVEVVGWLGVPAVQQGNVIGLSAGSVGIDEACSGVRSFHAALMVGIVVGELYQLGAGGRVGLAMGSLILAVVFNTVRTTWLTLQTARDGMSSLAKWHDPAGWATTIACFVAVWALAVVFKKRFASDGRGARRAGPLPGPELVAAVGRRRCRSYLVALGTWTIVFLGLTELWYRSHEKTSDDFARWTVVLSSDTARFHTVELPQRTRQLLGYDSGVSAKWQEADGADWTVYFFQWYGKTAESIMRARSHRPEICLPSTGIKQATDTREDYFEVPPLKLPFRHASYSADGEMLYVFYCLWQDGDETRKGMRTRGRADRLLGPWAGQRRFGQQVLEIITSGYPSAVAAEEAVRSRLSGLVQIESSAEPSIPSMAINLRNDPTTGANYGVH